MESAKKLGWLPTERSTPEVLEMLGRNECYRVHSRFRSLPLHLTLDKFWFDLFFAVETRLRMIDREICMTAF